MSFDKLDFTVIDAESTADAKLVSNGGLKERGGRGTRKNANTRRKRSRSKSIYEHLSFYQIERNRMGPYLSTGCWKWWAGLRGVMSATCN